jgi:hypothetical protein
MVFGGLGVVAAIAGYGAMQDCLDGGLPDYTASPSQQQDSTDLTAANFDSIVYDPSRTVAVLFTSASQDNGSIWVLTENTALSLRNRPDITVCRFNTDRPGNDVFYESLIQPGGPVKRATPRIVVYPKGNKEGVKFRGIPGLNLLPHFTGLREFIINTDARYPAGHTAAQTPTRGIPLSQQPAAIPYGMPMASMGHMDHKGTAQYQYSQYAPYGPQAVPYMTTPLPPPTGVYYPPGHY